MGFGENLKRLRESRDLTQAELAAILGVDRSAVAQWETEASYPRMAKAVEIVEFFDVSLDAIVSDVPRRRETSHNALTADERELLNIYRGLDANGRETAIRLLSALSPRSGDTGCVEEVAS